MKLNNYSDIKFYVEINYGFKLLSKSWKDSNSELIIKCPKGHIFKTLINGYISDNRKCPYCSGKKQLTLNYLTHTVKGFTILDSIDHNIIRVKCNKCNHVCDKKINILFKFGFRCNYCSRAKTRRKVFNKRKKFIEDNGFKCLSKFFIGFNNTIKIKIKCPQGHIFTKTWGSIQQYGLTCSICSHIKRRVTFEDATKLFNKFHYTVLSSKDSFKSRDSKIKTRCPFGHIYYATYNNFNHGNRCPKCKSSQGENLIRTILTSILSDNNIFTEQYRVKINGHYRYYDFCFPSLKLFLEYDGEFHYNKNDQKRLHRSYIRVHKADLDKDRWAVTHGFYLVRVSYKLPDSIVYRTIYNLLKDQFHLKVHDVKINYKKARLNAYLGYSIKSIAKYYLTHNAHETVDHFNRSHETINNYFKMTYGCKKREYLKHILKK